MANNNLVQFVARSEQDERLAQRQLHRSAVLGEAQVRWLVQVVRLMLLVRLFVMQMTIAHAWIPSFLRFVVTTQADSC